ncbi:MAG: glycoside hydrolase family 57 protein [Thermofilaceae archaeon]
MVGMQTGRPDIVLIFEVHQPYRLAQQPLLRRTFGKVETFEALEEAFFDKELTKRIFERVSSRCYKPATSMFLRLLDEHPGFRVSYSISGVLLEQAERWDPDLLELFKQAAKHKQCEVLCQTYFHSLAYFISRMEFIEQVEMHRRRVRDLLGVEPRVFENTELIYDNNVARIARELGFRAVVTEGVERVLGWRSPNYVYMAKGVDIKVLLRNYRLSDDVGFRFASVKWEEYPLTAEKYATWLAATPGQLICIFIDYETVGEHYPRETGIFDFFEWLPVEAEKRGLRFATPSEAIEMHAPVDEIDVPETISWADVERDASAWLGNMMQQMSLAREARLEPLVKALGDPAALRLWRLLSISDHYYYMSTKGGGPGEVHSYFSPYPSPYHAFAAFTEAIACLEAELFSRLARREEVARWVKPLPESEAFRFFAREGEPLPYVARSGLDLIEIVKRVPAQSLEFHVENGHLAEWLRSVVGDVIAAEKVEGMRGLRGEELRERLYKALCERLLESFSTAHRGSQCAEGLR